MTNQNNAAQAADQDPLSDEYVNAVIQRHGYQSPETVIARLYQWMGRHGGENGVTLLMYEAHKALSKLRAPVADTLPMEKALYELVNKIDTGLDTGDLVQDARRASAVLDAIMTSGDLVACSHEFFKDCGEDKWRDRYEKSLDFRIGWNACLDAIAEARSTRASAPAAGEAVGHVYSMEALVPGGRRVQHAKFNRCLPDGTLLYTRASAEDVSTILAFIFDRFGQPGDAGKLPDSVVAAVRRIEDGRNDG